jgi:hypothetical protein
LKEDKQITQIIKKGFEMIKKIALGFVAAVAISVPLAPAAMAQTDSAASVTDQLENIRTQIQQFFGGSDEETNCILCLNPGPQPRPCILCIPPGVVFGNGR